MAYTVETEPGKMKHSFTGLRPEFANVLIHKIMREAIVPFRVELMRRTEVGGETQVTEALRTFMLDCLQNIRSQFQKHANTAVLKPDATLAERKTRRDTYINTVLDKSNTAEMQSRKPDFTHSDEVLIATDAAVHTVTFDYTGLQDRDMAQPTPERIQNSLIREVVWALDKIMVTMSLSHSRDNPRTILAQEAAAWITDLDGVYEAVDSYDPGAMPFFPTAQSLNERDRQFNHDGSFDVRVTAGAPVGNFDGNDRVEAPDGPVETTGENTPLVNP